MRAAIRRIERLAPAPFVLILGTGGGLIQSLIGLTQPRGAAAIGAGLLTFTAAAIVWWLGVRRRRYSVWSIALQLTAAIALADLIGLAIVMLVFVSDMRHVPWRDAAVSAGTAQLGLSLIQFPVALALIAAGRFLPGIGPDRAALPPESGEHRDAVT